MPKYEFLFSVEGKAIAIIEADNEDDARTAYANEAFGIELEEIDCLDLLSIHKID